MSRMIIMQIRISSVLGENLRCLRENDMTCITQLPSEMLVRLSVMLPAPIRPPIDQRPIYVVAAAL